MRGQSGLRPRARHYGRLLQRFLQRFGEVVGGSIRQRPPNYGLSFDGLTSLSDAAAESLRKVEHLSPSAAEILRKHPSFQDDE